MKKIKMIILLAVAVCVSAMASPKSPSKVDVQLSKTLLETGHSWAQKGETKNAINCFKQSVDLGNSEAMVTLAGCYVSGYGVPKDLTEAEKLFSRAAEAGNVQGMFAAGLLAEQRKDYKTAVKWYKRSAAEDNVNAVFNLAMCYKDGKGVEQNSEKYLELLKVAEKGGHEGAKRLLKIIAILGYIQ